MHILLLIISDRQQSDKNRRCTFSQQKEIREDTNGVAAKGSVGIGRALK
jgi:hypothetical protein